MEIVALDSFKGCLSSGEANRAAAEGLLALKPEAEVIQVPVSDGGEGWLEAFRSTWGGETVRLTVRDPLMRPVTAAYLVKGDTAVIEMAQASGLTLLSAEERNPLVATSYGTGQLVVDAVSRGCQEIIVGLGGSATSDCGIGMLRAIIDGLARHGVWDDIQALDGVRFTIATDVTNPLCGENGAAHVFAPQKGATPEMVRTLDGRASRFAEVSARHFGYDRQDVPGAGAAGGMGLAARVLLGARIVPGGEYLLDVLGFDRLLEGADACFTGEGRADGQSVHGKAVARVAARCRAAGVPCIAVCGCLGDGAEDLLGCGVTELLATVGEPSAEAMRHAEENLRAAMRKVLPLR